MRYAKTHRNMATNRPSTVWILTSLASLESWHSQLFNDIKIIAMRPILMHFVAIFWFLVIFTRFFPIKRFKTSLFWRILLIFWYENDQKSKYCNEMHQYWSHCDDFSVVRQLRMPAFQRRQARQNPPNRRSIHDHVQKSTLLIRRAARRDIVYRCYFQI